MNTSPPRGRAALPISSLKGDGHLAADISREIGPHDDKQDVINSLLRSADGLDYDYPLRWQPGNIGNYLELASRALEQMTR